MLLTISGHVQLDEVFEILNVWWQTMYLIVAQAKFS